MVYSPDDPEANRKNFASPSQYSMTEQLLYKIASLDSAVQQGFRRLDEKMDRFQSDLHDAQIVTNDRINELDKEFQHAINFKRTRIDSLESRLTNTEREWETRYRQRCEYTDQKLNELTTWQKVAAGKAAIIAGGAIIVWAFVAPFIQNVFGL